MLRPYQRELIEDLNEEIANNRHIVAQMATGAGKTIVAGAVTRNMIEIGKRVLFTVPALELVDQTVERFYAAGIRDIGVIQADHPLTNRNRMVQVASVQTLTRRKLPPVDLVFLDEVHRWFDAYKRWLKGSWAHIPVIGLSATPWTRGLGKHFEKLIIGATTSELIEASYLARFRVFAPASPDLSKVRTVAGDFHEGDLSEAMDKSALVADVVSTWLQRGKGRPTLVFAVDRTHAKHLQQEFIAAGITAEYVDAFTPKDERKAIAERFRRGEVDVVANVGVLTTGVDWVNISCIVLARPTKSEMLFVQMVGRGLRTADSKDDCLILDHSDNHLRLGFVTEIAHDELDDGTKRQADKKTREVLPKKCPQCSFLKPPKTSICPACGFKPQPKCDVVNNDGELIEFVSRKAVKRPAPEELAIFYAELRQVQYERGYRAGWAAHKYKDRHGSFPPWSWNDAPTATPTAATLSWIRSRQIAFAKQRAAS